MPVLIYKCPNCDGDVRFDPESQGFKCEYCESVFSQEELLRYAPNQSKETASSCNRNDDKGDAVIYSCPTCGAEIVTDSTTAATFCFYCHNPVVLSGRLEGEYSPDKIIPFTLSREQAVERFLSWVGKKRYTPKAFFSKRQIEMLSGVYFPYWMLDAELEARLDAVAENVRVWRTGNVQNREVSRYRVCRGGTVGFKGFIKNALQKADLSLAEAVQPFDEAGFLPFSTAYLSGFMAEKRDIEWQRLEESAKQELEDYAKSMLKGSITGYSSVASGHMESRFTQESLDYVLLPVWVLTYAGRDGKMYYYAMNGQTGKVCGKLPTDKKKLWMLFAALALPIALAAMLIGWLLI